MKLAKTLAALALAVGTTSAAQAMTFDLGTLAPGGTYSVIDNPAVGAFTDVVNFTLGATSSVSDAFAAAGLDPLSVLLYSGSIPPGGSPVGPSIGGVPLLSGGGVAAGFATFSSLAAGSYALVISGMSNAISGNSGTHGFYGDVLATPVPEADTWLMMIIGAGLIGFQLRRRHQALPPRTITAG